MFLLCSFVLLRTNFQVSNKKGILLTLTYFVLKWGQGLEDKPHTPLSVPHILQRVPYPTRSVSFYEYLKKFFVDVFTLMIDLFVLVSMFQAFR